MVRRRASGIARERRSNADNPRTPGVVARRHARSLAGTISAAGSVAAGIRRRHARNLLPRRAGFSTLKNGAAFARSRPDYDTDQSGAAALFQNDAGLDAVCAAAGGRFHPYALNHMPDSSPSPPPGVPLLHRVQHGWRLFIFYSSAVLLTGVVSMLFADLLWRTGWSASRTVLLVLF